MTNVIEIVTYKGAYHTKYSGEEKENIVELFGTDTLPTPYTTATPIWEVMKIVQKNNPNYIVIEEPKDWLSEHKKRDALEARFNRIIPNI